MNCTGGRSKQKQTQSRPVFYFFSEEISPAKGVEFLKRKITIMKGEVMREAKAAKTNPTERKCIDGIVLIE